MDERCLEYFRAGTCLLASYASCLYVEVMYAIWVVLLHLHLPFRSTAMGLAASMVLTSRVQVVKVVSCQGKGSSCGWNWG